MTNTTNRDFFEGQSARLMFNVLTYCKAFGLMGMIAAGPGVGKSTTARHLVAKYPGVWTMTAHPAAATTNPVLRSLAGKLGTAQRPGQGSYDIWDEICRHVASAELGLIIVDEAQHLKLSALETLRSIHDATGVGLVLMGDLDLYRGILGRAQLASRISAPLVLPGPVDGDVEALAGAWSVTDARVLDLLKRVARTPGGLRIATQIMRDAEKRGGPTFDNALAAMKRLKIEVEK